MSRPADKPRLWPLRLVQLSPLLALALILATWFALPAVIRECALEPSTFDANPNVRGLPSNDPEVRLLLGVYPDVSPIDGWRVAGRFSPPDSASARLWPLSAGVSSRTMATAWRLHDQTGRLTPFALSSTDTAFAQIDTYEKDTKARVFAFAMPAVRNPPIVMSAIASARWLTSAERRELATRKSIERLREDTAKTMNNSIMAALRVSVSGGIGSYSDGDTRQVDLEMMLIHGRFYEIWTVCSPEARLPTVFNTTPFQLLTGETVDSPENQSRLSLFAKQVKGAIFVVGPLDATPVPLRAPAGASARECSGMASAAVGYLADRRTTMEYLRGDREGLPPPPTEMRGDPEFESLSTTSALGARGGRWLDVAVSQLDSVTVASADAKSWSVVDPVMLVAVFSDNPDATVLWNAFGRTPQHRFWIWLALRLRLVLGVLGVLLLASLIASPLAFWRERTLTAEIEFEREQERIRREARARVTDRLGELSRRIELAAEGSAAARGELTDSSADIDATIAELRRILGEIGDRGADRA